MVVVEVGGKELLLVRALGSVHAIDVLCTHADAFLDQGTLDGCELECPLHRARFDVRDGTVVKGPATVPVRTYPVQVVDGRIVVEVAS